MVPLFSPSRGSTFSWGKRLNEDKSNVPFPIATGTAKKGLEVGTLASGEMKKAMRCADEEYLSSRDLVYSLLTIPSYKAQVTP